MEWTPSDPGHEGTLGEENAHWVRSDDERGGGSMGKVVSVIGISKKRFQLHGATAGAEPALRRKLTRSNETPEFLGPFPA